MYVCAFMDAARPPQTMLFAGDGGDVGCCGLKILSVSSSVAEISFLLRREISSSFFFSVAIVVLAFPAALARLYLNRDLSDASRFLMLHAGGSVGVGMTDDDDDDGGGGVVVLIRCFLLILARRGDNNANDDNGEDGGGSL